MSDASPRDAAPALPPGGVPVGDEPPWQAWRPDEVAVRLADIHAPWYVAAGWAVDLHLGAQTRQHEDLEIAVPTAGFHEIAWAVADQRLHAAGHGRLWELPSPAFDLTYQTWVADPVTGVFRLDVFREPHDGDIWVCRRDPTLRMPYADLVWRTADGIPYQRPDVVLLFKAEHTRDKDEADLARLLSHLEPAHRAWLHHALARVHPDHPWLARIGAFS